MPIEVRKKTLGQEHKETLRSIGIVNLIYESGGRWEEAEQLELEVVETRKRLLSEEYPSTLNSMNNLALT